MCVGGAGGFQHGPPCRYRSLYDIRSSTPSRFIKEGDGGEAKGGGGGASINRGGESARVRVSPAGGQGHP